MSEKQEAVFGSRRIECYPWHIDTKYYDADVHFLLLPERDLVSESFSKAVEAVVFHVDMDSGSFALLDSWIPFVNEFEPEIKILVCDFAPESGQISRNLIQNWCIVNAFEFVELNPKEEEVYDDVEDDFHESNSYLRLRQALHAHPWPQLRLKGQFNLSVPSLLTLISCQTARNIFRLKNFGMHCPHLRKSLMSRIRTWMLKELHPSSTSRKGCFSSCT